MKTLSPKDKKKLKAYRKRYKDGKDTETIAEEIDRAESTVRSYFSSKEKEEFKEIFDPEEIEFMRFQLKTEIEEAKELSKDYISRAIQHEEVDPNAFLRAAKEERNAVKDTIYMMQQINVLDKPKDRVEHENRGESVEFNINTEKNKEEDGEVEEVES